MVENCESKIKSNYWRTSGWPVVPTGSRLPPCKHNTQPNPNNFPSSCPPKTSHPHHWVTNPSSENDSLTKSIPLFTNNSQIISLNHNLQQLNHPSSLPKLLIDLNRTPLKHFPFFLDLQQLIFRDNLNPVNETVSSIHLNDICSWWKQMIKTCWIFSLFSEIFHDVHNFNPMFHTFSWWCREPQQSLVFIQCSLFCINVDSHQYIHFLELIIFKFFLSELKKPWTHFQIHYWDENNIKPFSKHLKWINKMHQCNQNDFLIFHR